MGRGVGIFIFATNTMVFATVSLLCSDTSPDHEAQIEDATPALANLLNYTDARIVENALLGLVKILEGYTGTEGYP